MKQTDEFICPHCNRKTMQAVQRWENGDFIAVHSIRVETVKSAATGREVECEVATMCGPHGRIEHG